MTPEERQRLTDAMIESIGDRTLSPHPGGLAGRVADALDDAELIAADPNASPQAKTAARQFADALIAALAAE
jgi:hypothetical protein